MKTGEHWNPNEQGKVTHMNPKGHLWVTGSAKSTTSGSVDPAYVRSGHIWLQLSVPSRAPTQGYE